jgi:hypothetical protein
MKIIKVQFLEHDGKWIDVNITDDSRAAHALLGAQGKVYDDLRTIYRYKENDVSTTTG